MSGMYKASLHKKSPDRSGLFVKLLIRVDQPSFLSLALIASKFGISPGLSLLSEY
jgi:hypothetical protein